MEAATINFACRHYRGSRPCIFNKLDRSECPTCTHGSEFHDRVLFIKLDAIGDVLRSASMLPAIMARHDAPYIAWMTRRESVDLVGMLDHVDEVIELSAAGLTRVITGGWDQVYSLSNDLPSASLATAVAGRRPVVGYCVHDGSLKPSNAAAVRWLEMAAFDRVKRANSLSYQRLMLDIVGARGDITPPALRVPEPVRAAAAARVDGLFGGRTRPRVAVNVGSGGRWPKKMLGAAQIHGYIAALLGRRDVDVMLVGGAAEAEKTAEVMALSAGEARVRAALTPTSIPEFVATLMTADALLCGDTLALHIATAIGLPAVAVFGPTSLAEIFDFGGLISKIATPLLDCLSCYGDCDKTANCMTLLDVDALIERTLAQLARGRVP